MSAQQLAEEIEASISSAIGAFSSDIDTFQGVLDGKLLSVLKNLELDSDGYIKQSAANRRILYDAENLIYDLLPGSNYTAIVSQALTVIPAIDSLNSDYFSAISQIHLIPIVPFSHPFKSKLYHPLKITYYRMD
jgi:hypothetical protein